MYILIRFSYAISYILLKVIPDKQDYVRPMQMHQGKLTCKAQLPLINTLFSYFSQMFKWNLNKNLQSITSFVLTTSYTCAKVCRDIFLNILLGLGCYCMYHTKFDHWMTRFSAIYINHDIICDLISKNPT